MWDLEGILDEFYVENRREKRRKQTKIGERKLWSTCVTPL